MDISPAYLEFLPDKTFANCLESARYPSRKVNEIDNRGATFYLAMYWAQALAAQDKDCLLYTSRCV